MPQSPIITIALLPLTLLSALACGNAADPPTVAGALEQPGTSSELPDVEPGAAQDLGGTGELTPCPTSANDAVSADPGPATCDATIPERAFSSALCSCEDTSVAGFLRTRAFRSRAGEQTADRLGGSVGVNHSYITKGLADVGGSFSVAGRRDVLFGGFLKVGEDLRFNPAFDVAGLVNIGRDAALASDLRAVSVIDIGRDLIRAPESRFLGLAFVSVGGERISQPVDVAPPCGCAPDELIDVSALVAEARTQNDNASVGLESHQLDLVVGLGRVLTLPTGRYHLHQIAGAGALELRIDGNVSLFIDDDFYAAGLFRVSLAPGAELDLFVEDNLALAGAALIGDPQRPAATRIYAGGTGDIALAGLNVFAGNVYAPNANILVGGVGRVMGSLFGKNIIAAGFLDVGYDESVRDGHPECPPPGGGDPGGGDPGGGDPGGGDPGGGDPGGGDPGGDDPGGDDPGGDDPGGDDPGGDDPGGDTPGDNSPPPCTPNDSPVVR